MLVAALTGLGVEALGPGVPVATAVGQPAERDAQSFVAAQRKPTVLGLPDSFATAAWAASAVSA